MRLDALYLRAFGPFTDHVLDLHDGDHGVHVLYGPNEAGKSSALRAVRALLFGVPERTVDNFVHDNRALRVGGLVRPAKGEPFICFRRKGRKDTLLDDDGKPMDEGMLTDLLHGVDEARFSSLFGIDHESLVAGGRSLLAEHGSEGEALFGSGMGRAAVHQVLERLDREAEDLFKPGGHRPVLNAMLRELDDLRRQLRDAALSASRWDEARRERDRARDARDQAERALEEAQRRRAALERLRRTLPPLARLQELEHRRRGLGEPPALPGDFAQRRKDALEMLRTGRETVERAAARLRTLGQQMQGLVVDGVLLGEAEAIDSLHARLGQRRRALTERPALEARRTQLAATLEERLCSLSAADAGTAARTGNGETAGAGAAGPAPPGAAGNVDRRALAQRLSHRGRWEELARQNEGLQAQQRGLEQQLAECERKRQRCCRDLETLPPEVDDAGLADAVRAARALGEVDEQIQRLATRLAASEQVFTRAIAALGRWAGDGDALLAARLPDEGAVREFQARFQALDDDRRRLRDDGRDMREQKARAREALRALELAGPVPSEADLALARERREQGWAMVRQHWLGDGAAPGDPTEPGARETDAAATAQAFEAAVGEADQVADRLRREAQRVHERAACQAREEACSQQLEALSREEAVLAQARGALEDGWGALWAAAGVEAGEAAEMVGWLHRAQRVRDQRMSLDTDRDEYLALCRRRDAARERLGRALAGTPGTSGPDAGDPALAPLLARAESRLETLRDQARQRKRLSETASALADEGEDLAAGLAAVRAQREEWSAAWTDLGKALGLSRVPEPAALSSHFDILQAAHGLAEELADLTGQLGAMDEEAEGFARETAALCHRVAPALEHEPPEDAVMQLHGMLREQQQAHTRLQELGRQADDARREHDEAGALVQVAQATLATLCQEAGGVAPEQLEDVEQRDRDHRDVARALDAVREELVAQGDGAGVDALRAAAENVDADAVAGELEQLERHIQEELEPARKASAEASFTAERDFQQMSGSAEAAELASGVRQLEASVREHAAHYLRLRLAARVMREQIERFRREHRDPILASAGRYFRTLTEGSFESVDTDFDSSDEPVLVALRAGGQALHVDALSTGTRDQLYLGLRLAALDHYLEHAEPLPFVVDDILVQFDDTRTRATLQALAHFSRRTQVLLFTHHARVAEDARMLGGEGGGVFVHELSG